MFAFFRPLILPVFDSNTGRQVDIKPAALSRTETQLSGVVATAIVALKETLYGRRRIEQGNLHPISIAPNVDLPLGKGGARASLQILDA